jgi:hypothetical protein
MVIQTEFPAGRRPRQPVSEEIGELMHNGYVDPATVALSDSDRLEYTKRLFPYRTGADGKPCVLCHQDEDTHVNYLSPSLDVEDHHIDQVDRAFFAEGLKSMSMFHVSVKSLHIFALPDQFHPTITEVVKVLSMVLPARQLDHIDRIYATTVRRDDGHNTIVAHSVTRHTALCHFSVKLK